MNNIKYAIAIPKRIINEAIKRSIDLTDLISRALSLNPTGRFRAHLESTEKFLNEGVSLVDKDPVQASEKLHRAVEEAIKALAIALNLDEARLKPGQEGCGVR